MQLHIDDIDKFVKINNVPEVTNTIFLNNDGRPTEDGLFSYEIFGRQGTKDRTEFWGYINLHSRYLHPLIYKTCKQLDRKFQDIIAQSRYVSLAEDGSLIDDDENGWTGIDGLYKHWESINWGNSNKYGTKQVRIELLEAVSKQKAFITKWLVIPALFRDVDTKQATGGMIKDIPPINELYTRLMALAPEKDTGLSFLNGSRRYKAQETILEIHQSLLALTAKKKGIIQDKLLGKYVDYSARSVLSAPSLSNKPDWAIGKQEVPFGYVGVPLYLVINIFQPFIMKELDIMMQSIKAGENMLYYAIDKNGNSVRKTFEITDKVKSYISDELYKKWIDKFMRSQPDRISPIEIEFTSGKSVTFPFMDAKLGRITTLTDLFFLAATRVIENKHVMYTRYPVEDFRATHFAKVKIITTESTVEKKFSDNVVYEEYPNIDSLDNNQINWIDAFRMNNSVLKAIGGDLIY